MGNAFGKEVSMENVHWYWLLSAVGLIIAAHVIGVGVRGHALGILVDRRGRFSLSQLQLVIWTIVILSLIVAVFIGRFNDELQNPLQITVPETLLGLMGIGLGSAASASAIKSAKDQARPNYVAASNTPQWLQLFTMEEGTLADKVIDIGKFQNFWLTLILVIAYVAVAANGLKSTISGGTLPEFPASMLLLLGISHAGYLANKLPNQAGTPQELTVAERDRMSVLAKTVTPSEEEQISRNAAPRPLT
jgi:hypothetical protein